MNLDCHKTTDEFASQILNLVRVVDMGAKGTDAFHQQGKQVVVGVDGDSAEDQSDEVGNNVRGGEVDQRNWRSEYCGEHSRQRCLLMGRDGGILGLEESLDYLGRDGITILILCPFASFASKPAALVDLVPELLVIHGLERSLQYETDLCGI